MKANNTLLANAMVLALLGILAGAVAGMGVGLLTGRSPARQALAVNRALRICRATRILRDYATHLTTLRSEEICVFAFPDGRNRLARLDLPILQMFK